MFAVRIIKRVITYLEDRVIFTAVFGLALCFPRYFGEAMLNSLPETIQLNGTVGRFRNFDVTQLRLRKKNLKMFV